MSKLSAIILRINQLISKLEYEPDHLLSVELSTEPSAKLQIIEKGLKEIESQFSILLKEYLYSEEKTESFLPIIEDIQSKIKDLHLKFKSDLLGTSEDY